MTNMADCVQLMRCFYGNSELDQSEDVAVTLWIVGSVFFVLIRSRLKHVESEKGLFWDTA